MTDQRFTTEEAERIAEWIDCYHGFGCGCANKAAADALRDLAAERDALREALRKVSTWPKDADPYDRAVGIRGYAAEVLKENQS